MQPDKSAYPQLWEGIELNVFQTAAGAATFLFLSAIVAGLARHTDIDPRSGFVFSIVLWVSGAWPATCLLNPRLAVLNALESRRLARFV